MDWTKTVYTERTYDDLGQLTQVAAPEVPDPSGMGTIVYTQNFLFDVLGRRTRMGDYNGNHTALTLDVLGRVINVLDAEGYNTQSWFDARGLAWQTLTARGATYTNTYDARGLRTQLDMDHDAVTDTTTFLYDDNGRQYQVDYPDGGQLVTGYDELGRKVLSSTLHSGSDYLDTTYEYDLDNRLRFLTLPGGYVYERQYYAVGTLHISTDAASDDTTFTYDLDNRQLTSTHPNGLIVTQDYDWKTGGVNSTTQCTSASSGDDIVMGYTYDANGQAIIINDGNSQDWTKAYDAMLRLVSLETPDPGGGTFTQTLTLDGNGNITQTNDFNGTDHYYQYDGLNRMTGHGTTNTANDEVYYWNCCNEVSGYDDSFSTGTATLVYDDLGRLTSHIDSAGSEVQYEYDALGRLMKLTPPQGNSYRTEYTYNLNGSLDTCTIYDGSSGQMTSYTYDLVSGSGLLLQRDLPVRSAHNNRTAYAYDGAGRLVTETVSLQGSSGGTICIFAYGYTWLTYGREMTRTESHLAGGPPPSPVIDSVTTYQYNTVGWQNYEDRVEGANTRYTIDQTYDYNGNRTGYNKSVQGGQTATYGRSTNLTTVYDELNRPVSVTDSAQGLYSAAFTTDANGNITEIQEDIDSPATSTLYSYFDIDDLNRVTANRVKYYDTGLAGWKWIKRAHQYSGTGAILESTYKTWNDGSMEPAGDSLLHSWDQEGKHVQNTDTGATTFGKHWQWAGAAHSHGSPLYGPNADTANSTAYNQSAKGGAGTPQRRTFTGPGVQGDERVLWAQGRPEAKASVSDWATGKISDNLGITANPAIESRYEFTGTVTATDLSRATDAREKGRMGFFGSGYSYYGASPRMTSETVGRDINPLGRGDGFAYVGGMLNMGRITPSLPMTKAQSGTGTSVNNDNFGGRNEYTQYETNSCSCCAINIDGGIGIIDKPRCFGLMQSMMQVCGEAPGSTCNQQACRQAKCDLAKCMPTSPVDTDLWYWDKPTNEAYCCGGADGGGVGAGGGTFVPPSGCPGCHGGGGDGIPPVIDPGFRPGGSRPMMMMMGSGGGGIGGMSGGSLFPGSSPLFMGSILPVIIGIGALLGIPSSSQVPSPGGPSRFDQCCCCCGNVCSDCSKMAQYIKEMRENYSSFNILLSFLGFIIGAALALSGAGLVAGIYVLLGMLALYVAAIENSRAIVMSRMSEEEKKCYQCIVTCLKYNGTDSWDEILSFIVSGLIGLVTFPGDFARRILTAVFDALAGVLSATAPTDPWDDWLKSGSITCPP